jgi:hypothetical protein
MRRAVHDGQRPWPDIRARQHPQFQATDSVNLEQWSKTPVWKNPAQCIGNIDKSMTGTLEHPPISENGRAFLADLLTQLTDAQLHDLFDVARFPLRSGGVKPGKPMTTTAEWVDAFKHKRDAIVKHSCPDTAQTRPPSGANR